MRQQTRSSKEPAEKVVQDIRRATRNQYSAEEKIRIVLEGLRGGHDAAALMRRAILNCVRCDQLLRHIAKAGWAAWR
jgi:hypothetical protein